MRPRHWVIGAVILCLPFLFVPGAGLAETIQEGDTYHTAVQGYDPDAEDTVTCTKTAGPTGQHWLRYLVGQPGSRRLHGCGRDHQRRAGRQDQVVGNPFPAGPAERGGDGTGPLLWQRSTQPHPKHISPRLSSRKR